LEMILKRWSPVLPFGPIGPIAEDAGTIESPGTFKSSVADAYIPLYITEELAL